jgi:hypothetical protein
LRWAAAVLADHPVPMAIGTTDEPVREAAIAS